ncbi:MAG: hypothetical protein AB3N21_08810 [Ruegeria sp.]|uniref:hypothetical protein n=1 Tax=Ruegeria sp. TaxID=1879320 RepID=UPI00349E66A6
MPKQLGKRRLILPVANAQNVGNPLALRVTLLLRSVHRFPSSGSPCRSGPHTPRRSLCHGLNRDGVGFGKHTQFTSHFPSWIISSEKSFYFHPDQPLVRRRKKTKKTGEQNAI